MTSLWNKENIAKIKKCFDSKDNTITCYWIGYSSIILGGIGLILELVEATKPLDRCDRCLPPATNQKLSIATAVIYAFLWLTSFPMVHGLNTKNKKLLKIWLWSAALFVLTHFAWAIIILPVMPTIRGCSSVIILIFAIHAFFDVKSEYAKYAEDDAEAAYNLKHGIIVEDDLPQVVCLNPGDVTQEEYDQLRAEGKLDDLSGDRPVVQGPQMKEEGASPTDGKILFRKPTKRSSKDREQDPERKKQKSEDKRARRERRELEKQHKLKLLSFNEDEEDANDI